MPFCNISRDVSLHYITNSPTGDVQGFDYSKPTILLIPPMFHDVTWLREQFKDARLSRNYNLIAFDQRQMGRTRAPLSPKRDTWVDAADLAIAHELLQLPPCHVFGVSMNAGGALFRFALLCPSKVVSICIVAFPNQAGEDPDWVPQGYMEMHEAWCFPQDIETLERACMEFSWFLFNTQISPELNDEVIAWWQVNMPPTKRSNFLAQGLCGMNRHRFTDKELACLEQPVLFLQGDKSPQTPINKAQEVADKIKNARLFVVKGGPEMMTMIPEYASVVHRVYLQFLSSLPDLLAFQPLQPDPEGVARGALARLAHFVDDPSVATRDPADILSFCMFTEEQIQQNAGMLAHFAVGEKEAFHALDERGRPLRKFSDRHADEWTPAAFQRMSQNMSVVSPIDDHPSGDAKITPPATAPTARKSMFGKAKRLFS